MDDVTQFEHKKQSVIEILKRLQGIWDLAEGFLLLVRSEYVTEGVLDVLIDTIQQTIAQVKIQGAQMIVDAVLSDLEKIKQAEALTYEEDQSDLHTIMSEIETLF